MLHYAKAVLRRALTAAETNIFEFPTIAGKLVGVRVTSDLASTGAPTVFDVKIANASIYALASDRPQIADGAASVTQTNLTRAVLDEQKAQVDLVSVPSSGIGNDLLITVIFDDGLLGATPDTIITDAYLGALNRAPTTAERTAANTTLSTNTSAATTNQGRIDAVSAWIEALYASSEGVTYQATLANDAYVENLYRAFLGRASDTAGKAQYVAELVGGATRGVVRSHFPGGLEFANNRVAAAFPLSFARTQLLIPAGDVNTTTNSLAKIQNRVVQMPALPTTIGDEFPGTALDTSKWAYGWAGSAAAISVANGAAKLPPAETGNDTGLWAQPLRDWRGRTVSAQITLNGNQDFDFGFTPRDTTTGGLFLTGVRPKFNYTGGLLRAFINTPAGYTIQTSVNYDAVAHKFQRFRHDNSANTLYWETSPDGATWTAFASAGIAVADFAAGLTSTGVGFAMHDRTGASFALVQHFVTDFIQDDTLLRGQVPVWDAVQGKFVTSFPSRIPVTTGAPTTGEVADATSVPSYFDKATNKLYVHNGVSWVSVTLA